MLENEVHGAVRVHSVEFEGESAESCTVAVVSAFVGDAWILGGVGEIQELGERESVHVCAEGDSVCGLDVAGGVEPFSAVDDGEPGVGLDEVHEAEFGLGLLAGEFWVLVEFVA